MIHTKILVIGKLDPTWSDWFETMQIDPMPGGDTLLCGDLLDSSAVYGILSRLSSLGIRLKSVSCEESHSTGPPS